MGDDKPQTTGHFHIKRVISSNIAPNQLQYLKEDMTRCLLNTLALALADGRERTVQVFEFRRDHPFQPWQIMHDGPEEFIEYEINALALLLDPKQAQVGEYVVPYLMPKLQPGATGAVMRLPVYPGRSVAPEAGEDSHTVFDIQTLTFEPVEFRTGGPHSEYITVWLRTA